MMICVPKLHIWHSKSTGPVVSNPSESGPVQRFSRDESTPSTPRSQLKSFEISGPKPNRNVKGFLFVRKNLQLFKAFFFSTKNRVLQSTGPAEDHCTSSLVPLLEVCTASNHFNRKFQIGVVLSWMLPSSAVRLRWFVAFVLKASILCISWRTCRLAREDFLDIIFSIFSRIERSIFLSSSSPWWPFKASSTLHTEWKRWIECSPLLKPLHDPMPSHMPSHVPSMSTSINFRPAPAPQLLPQFYFWSDPSLDPTQAQMMV